MRRETRSFVKFYRLLRLMPGWRDDDDELKEKLVWQFTDCRTNNLREMKQKEYDQMIDYMEGVCYAGQTEARKRPGYYDDEAEIWRKRAIAAVFGFYGKIKEPVTLDYVKGIICRSGGVTDINRIPPVKMREIYNVWLMKQRVKGNIDKVVDEELVKYGYLEEGGVL